jgi:hypothetical protein
MEIIAYIIGGLLLYFLLGCIVAACYVQFSWRVLPWESNRSYNKLHTYELNASETSFRVFIVLWLVILFLGILALCFRGPAKLVVFGLRGLAKVSQGLIRLVPKRYHYDE